MSGLFLRRVNFGLLLIALVFPASSWHVCRCARAASAATAATPLRPCCAKRLAQTAKPSSSLPNQPAIKARCCCDDFRWNQVNPKIVTAKSHEWNHAGEIAWGDHVPSFNLSHHHRNTSVDGREVRAGPGVPRLIALCRWQV